MKETKNQTVYIRKSSQATLRELSEKTRLSQSEIIAQWLTEIQKVINEFPECYRITYMAIADLKSKPRRIVCLLAPIICESLQFSPTNLSESVDETLADIEVRKDIEKKVTKK